MAEELKVRSEVSEDLKWDLTGIFATEEDFNQAFAAFPEKIADFVSEYKGNLKTAEDVVAALHEYEEVLASLPHLSQYRSLPIQADITDGEAASAFRSVS